MIYCSKSLENFFSILITETYACKHIDGYVNGVDGNTALLFWSALVEPHALFEQRETHCKLLLPAKFL